MTASTSRPPLRRASARRRRVTATGLGLAGLLAIGGALAGCSHGTSESSSTTTAPPFSVTIPPGAIDNGTVRDVDGGTVAAGGGPTTGPAPSVATEDQSFCITVQRAATALADPASDSTPDDQQVATIKATFQTLLDQAPSTIKPEVQGMNNVIQTVNTIDDVQKLDDPDFVNEQAAVGQWVQAHCGVPLG